MTDAGFTPPTMDAGSQPTSCAPLGSPLLAGAAPYARGDTAFAYDDDCARVYMFSDKAVPQLCSFPPSDFVTEGWFFDLNTRFGQNLHQRALRLWNAQEPLELGIQSVNSIWFLEDVIAPERVGLILFSMTFGHTALKPISGPSYLMPETQALLEAG